MSKEFEELLAELEGQQEAQTTLAKAMADGDGEGDDEAIQAAAGDGSQGDDDEDDLDDDDAAPPMAKSIQVGEQEFQVVDADALIKSLSNLTNRVESGEAVLAKALQSMVEAAKAQGELIKSLQAKLDKLAGTGAGRKTVLTVHEKPAGGDQTLAKSQQDGLTPKEFLAKSVAALEAGKISGLEATTIDVCLRQNQPIDQALIGKVLG